MRWRRTWPKRPLLAVSSVLGPDEGFQQVGQVALDPLAQHEAVVAGKSARVVARPPSAVRGKAVKPSRSKSPRRTEPDKVVTERRHVPVTVGTADDRRLIEERAATQHTDT